MVPAYRVGPEVDSGGREDAVLEVPVESRILGNEAAQLILVMGVKLWAIE